MSTEYRRGIPSTAHVEAATRLGLLWHREGDELDLRFNVQNRLGRWRGYGFRPIRPDGTPVDWEVLDQEVARVGQQGQSQGFRADLWRRICRHFTGREVCDMVSFDQIVSLNETACHFTQWYWDWRDVPGASAAQTDILARWTVYQELKPLYDLVDGTQGEAAMPRDVEAEWDRQAGADTSDQYGDLRLVRSSERLSVQLPRPTDLLSAGFLNLTDDPATGYHLSTLRNFAAVLDAVAERRVAERMRGQAPANPNTVLTVTSERRVNVEPRRFADVRPDRHGWRWWRLFGSDCGALGTPIEANPIHGWRVKDDPDADWHLLGHYNSAVDGIRTVIPTDEQGNPVSWEAIVPAGTVQSGRHQVVGIQANRNGPVAVDTLDAATESEVQRITQVVASITQQALQQTLGSPVTVSPTTGHVAPPTAIAPTPSRFALIEIDDADPTTERIRQEQETERQRLAQLRQRLAAERAAQPQEMAPTTTSRFNLIEPDPQADPAASIRAWEARQAATKVRPAAAPPRIMKPATAPRRPAIEVVDAEVDGLSRVEIVTALVGRAFNGGC